MASGVYNRFKFGLMKAIYDLATEVVKAALLTNAYAFNADNRFWSDVSGNEVSGTGYGAGGQTASSPIVAQDNTNDRASFDAADVTWANSTITARYAILYDTATSSSDLICCFDFGQDYSSSNGNFTIQWNASGILLLT